MLIDYQGGRDEPQGIVKRLLTDRVDDARDLRAAQAPSATSGRGEAGRRANNRRFEAVGELQVPSAANCRAAVRRVVVRTPVAGAPEAVLGPDATPLVSTYLVVVARWDAASACHLAALDWAMALTKASALCATGTAVGGGRSPCIQNRPDEERETHTGQGFESGQFGDDGIDVSLVRLIVLVREDYDEKVGLIAQEADIALARGHLPQARQHGREALLLPCTAGAQAHILLERHDLSRRRL